MKHARTRPEFWAAGFGLVLAAATWFHGGTADHEWLACVLGLSLLSGAYWALRPAGQSVSGPDLRLSGLVASLVAFPLLQMIPLPLNWLSGLSPAHGPVYESLAPVSPAGAAPLTLHPAATARSLVSWLAYAAAALLAADLVRRLPRRAWNVALPVVIVAVLQAGLGLAQHLTAERQVEATGTYVNHNHFAGLLEMSLPFAFLLSAVAVGRLRERQVGPWAPVRAGLGILAAAAVFAGVVVSYSRMGFISALAGLVLMGGGAAWAAGHRTRRWWVRAAVPGAALAAFVFLPSDRFIASYSRLASMESFLAHGRYWLWKDTLGLIADYPVFGSGLGAYESAFSRYKTSWLHLHDDHAHNDYLELLAELGGVGFLLGALLVGLAASRAWRAWRTGRSAEKRLLGLACLSSLAAIGVHSLADFNLYLPANALLFAWILGVSAGLSTARGASCRSGGRAPRPVKDPCSQASKPESDQRR